MEFKEHERRTDNECSISGGHVITLELQPSSPWGRLSSCIRVRRILIDRQNIIAFTKVGCVSCVVAEVEVPTYALLLQTLSCFCLLHVMMRFGGAHSSCVNAGPSAALYAYDLSPVPHGGPDVSEQQIGFRFC